MFFLALFKCLTSNRILLKSLRLSLQWAIPFMILIVSIESHLIISYLVSVAAGVSVAAAFLLPWLVPPNSSDNIDFSRLLFLLMFFIPFRSMLPDVVDDFKVRNPDMQGYEALFFSFYVFFIKFASGVSLGISTLSLK